LAENLKSMVGRFRVDGRSPTAAAADGMAGTNVRHAAGGELIPWGPHLSVGVLTMDAHHRKLVDMINELHAAMRERRGLAVTSGLLKSLSQYVKYHFHEEEVLMERANYEGIGIQKEAHRYFLDAVAKMEKRWLEGDKSVPAEMMSLLQNWLVKHIQTLDKQYGPHLSI
jgi:hemerythrin